MFSIPGQIRLDDVAVIRSTLGYDVLSRGGCLTIRHPFGAVRSILLFWLRLPAPRL
ncbi:MAG: hypothetical protein HC840_21355 [Leptolyngbyaceae cyanobacterium RM2_2_4]|nr:hypothetical protein [Leptolyngbyaceae cyanobacterium RM2_2_4]